MTALVNQDPFLPIPYHHTQTSPLSSYQTSLHYKSSYQHSVKGSVQQ